MVIPFAPTARWVAHYLRGKAGGVSDGEAALSATRRSGLKGKDMARCQIKGGQLGVPVEGGSGKLKSGKNPRVSEHGKWRREHLGAWQAAYGKSPFYIHVMPALEQAYANSKGKEIETFNREVLEVALEWIDPDALRLEEEKLSGVREETRLKIERDLSIFDAIFRLGNMTAFGL